MLKNIFTYITILTVPLVLFYSCDSEDGEDIASQRTSFGNYLTGKGVTVAEAYETGANAYIQDDVYVYIANADRASWATDTQAIQGDSVTYRYSIYQFSSGFTTGNTTTITMPLQTNRADIISIIENSLEIELEWSTTPEKAKLGSTPMIEGLKRGMPNVREQDSVLLFITSDLAFGSKPYGSIPENTPLIYILNIDNVKKQ